MTQPKVYPRAGHPVLGSFVLDLRSGLRGRVIGVHYGCPEDNQWLAEQSGLTDDYAQGRGIWYSVLVQPEGSIRTPANQLVVVEPFEFRDDYWGRMNFGRQES